MQNWNDGKAQEFKDRKVYDVGASLAHRFGEQPEQKPTETSPADCKTAASCFHDGDLPEMRHGKEIPDRCRAAI